MEHLGLNQSAHGLENHGVKEAKTVYWNLPVSRLIEHELAHGKGRLADNGAMVVSTGQYTGRSPKDKYIVEEPSSKDKIWWGKVNVPMPESTFDELHREIIDYYKDKNLYVLDTFAGADPEHRLPVRIVNTLPWQNMFCRQLFIDPSPGEQQNHVPQFTILSAPMYQTDAVRHKLNSGTFIAVNIAKRLILVGGSQYAGEMKKSIFSVMNYLLPLEGVMPMHCSANVGADGETAIFFGLSGTGKTTLSADPERGLIGDDEHGWTEKGIFNFEGGCYAKCINLSHEDEPVIWNAIRFGSLLENVVMDGETRELDFNDGSLTQNTRAAYPMTNIDHAVIPSVGKHPKNVVFLTCDAFGVLPPVSRLTPDQASYHFVSGYTAKVAGTERGAGDEPSATFSACFGAPFMPLHPGVYAELLAKKIEKHGSNVWLINTGWIEGPYGVGHRIKISHTRAIVHAALDGALENAKFVKFPFFGFEIPVSCPGVPDEILNPRDTWKDKAEYDAKAKHLAELFIQNFEQFKEGTAPEIVAAGPSMEG